jgi:parallel beta helix pectate lyase-like protein
MTDASPAPAADSGRDRRVHRAAAGWHPRCCVSFDVMKSDVARMLRLALALGAFVSAAGRTANAWGLGISGTTDPPDPDNCLSTVKLLSFTATPATTDPSHPSTLAWNVQMPAGCGARVDLGGPAVAPQGSVSVQPVYTAAYALRVSSAGKTRLLRTVIVTVMQPSMVSIHTNDVLQFLAAVTQPVPPLPDGTPGTRQVSIDNQVSLDLTNRWDTRIAAGVILSGGRSPRDAGALLFTTASPPNDGTPRYFLEVAGNGVQIHGLRIQGADMDVSEDNFASGIFVDSMTGVEIDDNEISGWSGSGVKIEDTYMHIQPWDNPSAVHVHDNFIHHNQHDGTQGYGVSVGDGAYALIERNVFDINRHAIAGDGSDWSGYAAYYNLVLPHGGCNHDIGGWCVEYTHQFDMHGQDDCFPIEDANCGTAGYSMDIRYNSLIYDHHVAIHLRGTPQQAMTVVDNVFSEGSQGDAIAQNETGLVAYQNIYGVNGLNELATCDFDGDGVLDTFLATGITWWYSSGGTGPWTYLNASFARRADLTLGDLDGDRRCDVRIGASFWSGGTGPMLPVPTFISGGAGDVLVGGTVSVGFGL